MVVRIHQGVPTLGDPMRLIIVDDEQHNLLDLVLKDHIDCLNRDRATLENPDEMISDIKTLLECVDEAK